MIKKLRELIKPINRYQFRPYKYKKYVNHPYGRINYYEPFVFYKLIPKGRKTKKISPYIEDYSEYFLNSSGIVDITSDINKLIKKEFIQTPDEISKLMYLTKDTLKFICKDNNLKISGNKKTLANRIVTEKALYKSYKKELNNLFITTEKGLDFLNNNQDLKIIDSLNINELSRYFEIREEYKEGYDLDFFKAGVDFFYEFIKIYYDNAQFGSLRNKFLELAKYYQYHGEEDLSQKLLVKVFIMDVSGLTNSNFIIDFNHLNLNIDLFDHIMDMDIHTLEEVIDQFFLNYPLPFIWLSKSNIKKMLKEKVEGNQINIEKYYSKLNKPPNYPKLEWISLDTYYEIMSNIEHK